MVISTNNIKPSSSKPSNGFRPIYVKSEDTQRVYKFKVDNNPRQTAYGLSFVVHMFDENNDTFCKTTILHVNPNSETSIRKQLTGQCYEMVDVWGFVFLNEQKAQVEVVINND